jgi:putative oxidoreductase
MSPEFDAKFKSFSVNALRIAAGATYFSHGAQKLFGWFGGMGPNHGTVDLMTKFGAAGVIEATCGAMIILGLFTRPFAFIASGEMAVTYFWMHWGGSGHMWWWDNHGELPLLYSFIWLTYAAFGAGSFSVDAMIAKRGKTQ